MIAAFGPVDEMVEKDNPLKRSSSLEMMRTMRLKWLLGHSRSVFFELVGYLTFRQHGAIVQLLFHPGKVSNQSCPVANVRRPEP